MCTALNLLIISFILGIATEPCTTPNNERAECISLYECPLLANSLAHDPIGHFEFVRRSKCGGDAIDTYVCCGKAANFTQSLHVANKPISDHSSINKWQDVSSTDKKTDEQCTTHYGVEGTCTPLYTCSPLLRAYANPLRGLEKHYLKYRCRDIDTYICCEPAWYTSGALSDRSYCGLQRRNDYPPVTGKSRTSSIEEFPWLAAIRVPKFDRNVCQGVLINVRYVLTAAHCFISSEYQRKDVTSVRLGGYHVRGTRYCAELSQYGGTDCAGTEEFGVEETILHPLYFESININDIALIRLDRTVTYTDFIRPICLPIPGTVFAKPGDILYATGWGKSSQEGSKAHVKKKITTKLIDSKQCEARLKVTPVPVTHLQICTVDLSNNTEFTCGDVGVPVMFVHENQWHIEGITTKSLPCRSGFPQVETEVSQYLAWIKQNIRLHDV